jgi:hypothetical protein
MRFPWTIQPHVILLGIMCVVAAAALIAALQPSHQADIASADAPPEVNMTPRPAPASVETKPTVESPKAVALVTITGCLELDEETFWLREASGSDAPMSRSWKSGFLKKRPPSIKLVDATNALRLPRHVGQRVAATGTLMNREIRASSLLRVATSCS